MSSALWAVVAVVGALAGAAMVLVAYGASLAERYRATARKLDGYAAAWLEEAKALKVTRSCHRISQSMRLEELARCATRDANKLRREAAWLQRWSFWA